MQVNSNISYPEEVLLTLKSNDKKFILEIKRIAAIDYYKNQKLSLGRCAELAEMSKEEFIKYLGKHEISIFRFDSEEELLEDIRNA